MHNVILQVDEMDGDVNLSSSNDDNIPEEEIYNHLQFLENDEDFNEENIDAAELVTSTPQDSNFVEQQVDKSLLIMPSTDADICTPKKPDNPKKSK